MPVDSSHGGPGEQAGCHRAALAISRSWPGPACRRRTGTRQVPGSAAALNRQGTGDPETARKLRTRRAQSSTTMRGAYGVGATCPGGQATVSEPRASRASRARAARSPVDLDLDLDLDVDVDVVVVDPVDIYGDGDGIDHVDVNDQVNVNVDDWLFRSGRRRRTSGSSPRGTRAASGSPAASRGDRSPAAAYRRPARPRRARPRTPTDRSCASTTLR
jgi:hypothetical protein